MSEQWRVCQDYPDYEVSDLGRVRRATAGIRTFAGKIHTGFQNRDGYQKVRLYLNRVPKDFYVHRLVVISFVGPIPAGMEINHKNGIKTDNRACNLEIVSKSENVQHSFDVLNRVQHNIRARGESNASAKLTVDKVREARALYARGVKKADLARQFGVSEHSMACVISRKTWRHVTD